MLSKRRTIHRFLMFFLMFSWFLASTSLRAEVLIPITIEKGTNLIKLTRKYCTSHYHWKEIAKINKLSPPYTIIAGSTLYAPIELVKKEKVVARVASVIGGVFIVKHGKKLTRVVKGGEVFPGQTIVTEEDGFAHIIFPDNKYTRIASNSKFTLTYMVRLVDDSLKAEFFLEKGRITHSVKKKLKANETFSTRTPVSVTGVRGTEYRVKMEKSQTNVVETLRGVVELRGGGRSVKIKGGEGVIVEKGKSPTAPVKLPQIVQGIEVQEIYRKLPIVITAPSQAEIKKYRLSVTTDAEGTDTVLELLATPGQEFTLLAVPDGKYFGFLTAIGQNNLESLPMAPVVFRLRTIPGPPLVKVPLDGKVIFGDKVDLTWLDQEHAEQYFVQVASDEVFSMVVDEKLQDGTVYKGSNLAEGRYFFRVQSVAKDGFRSLFSLTDRWQMRQKPTLKSFEGSLEDGVHLKWGNMGEDIIYDLQMSKKKDFTSLVKDVHGLQTPSFSLKDSLEPGTYYVRVRGVMENGQISPWTPYQILKIPQPSFGILDTAVLVGILGLSLL